MTNHRSVRVHLIYICLLFVVLVWHSYAILRMGHGTGANRAGWAPTKVQVVAALGRPTRIYAPGMRIPNMGAIPPPPPSEGREVWVYVRLAKLTFVYFDAAGRVQMVFYATT